MPDQAEKDAFNAGGDYIMYCHINQRKDSCTDIVSDFASRKIRLYKYAIVPVEEYIALSEFYDKHRHLEGLIKALTTKISDMNSGLI